MRLVYQSFLSAAGATTAGSVSASIMRDQLSKNTNEARPGPGRAADQPCRRFTFLSVVDDDTSKVND